MYQPTNFMKKAVEEGNVDRVRGALTGVIQSDPGFETKDFDQALAYVRSNGINPFVEENDPTLPLTDDFSTALTYLRNNFTQERLEHIRKVGKATHPQKDLWSSDKPSVTIPGGRNESRPSGPMSRVETHIPGGQAPKKAKGHWVWVVLALVALLVMAYLCREAGIFSTIQ